MIKTISKSKKKNVRTGSVTIPKKLEVLYQRIANYLRGARQNVLQSIDTEMVKAYWFIGKDIVEAEQQGKKRAAYGQELLVKLSVRLSKEFGRGYSISNLRNMRQFYLVYAEEIHQTLSGELAFKPELPWSSYCLLMQISSKETRRFYEKEAIENNWSVRELNRQINSLLFERLLKSKDKKELLQLAKKGQEVRKPQDAIKDPIILEFLEIPESHCLVESKLEEALTDNLQKFLLELGKGFAFVARQKRLSFDNQHFYADLVFYHTILKCYVIIDIKTHELTHADLGQIQLYINYYDAECKRGDDNPTIGLILCTKKNDAMVKYFLADNAQKIFASKYQFHLPSEEELVVEMKRELKILERS